MSLPLAQLLRGLAVALLFGAWAVAAHYASSGNGSADVNAALGVLPIAAALTMLLWRIRNPFASAAGGLCALLLLAWLWPQLRSNVPLLYYLQHLGTHLALGTLFGRSLLGPGEALITRIARTVFGDISVRKQRYTRQVTVAWTIFFFANALLSTALFLFAPPAIWSVHANLLTAPLIGLMFLGEHLVRLRKLPPEERPSFITAIRAYRASTQQGTTTVEH
ncbi:hypothetical protein [Azonexus sp.]|uniref:COG4648 family protein n=1 Tax=Azonexus sp. TaxID=1872668 RepID=UPI0027B9945C|nr:hypothetical protein [Azonexus sp.]